MGSHLGVVYESSTLTIWWKITGCGIFEAFDDGLVHTVSPSAHSPSPPPTPANPYRLSRSIMSDNQRKRRMELNGLTAGIVE